MHHNSNIATLDAQDALDRELLASKMLELREAPTPAFCARVINLPRDGLKEGFEIGDGRSAAQTKQLGRTEAQTKKNQKQKGSTLTNDQVGGAGEEQLVRCLGECLTFRNTTVNHEGCSAKEKAADIEVLAVPFDVKTVWVQRKEHFSLPFYQAKNPHAPYLAVVKFLDDAGTSIDVFVCKAEIAEGWQFRKGRPDYFLVPLDKAVVPTYQ